MQTEGREWGHSGACRDIGVYLWVCICICLWEGERGRTSAENREWNRESNIWNLYVKQRFPAELNFDVSVSVRYNSYVKCVCEQNMKESSEALQAELEKIKLENKKLETRQVRCDLFL